SPWRRRHHPQALWPRARPRANRQLCCLWLQARCPLKSCRRPSLPARSPPLHGTHKECHKSDMEACVACIKRRIEGKGSVTSSEEDILEPPGDALRVLEGNVEHNQQHEHHVHLFCDFK